jgi:hypothetical protein
MCIAYLNKFEFKEWMPRMCVTCQTYKLSEEFSSVQWEEWGEDKYDAAENKWVAGNSARQCLACFPEEKDVLEYLEQQWEEEELRRSYQKAIKMHKEFGIRSYL